MEETIDTTQREGVLRYDLARELVCGLPLAINKETMNSSVKPRAKGSWSVLLLVAESVFGFVWWSTFVEFLSTLWFFPLEKMDFSGLMIFLCS